MIDERYAGFLHAIWSRRPTVTYIIFGFNLLLFLLMGLAGGSGNELVLTAFGVKDNFFIDQGEFWRFVTPVFLHIGPIHILFNSYAIWVVGPQVEKLYGGARFTIIYVLTGIAGVAGSYWRHPETPSAGASGAIFGLFGALLVFGFRYRDIIPPMFQRAVGRGVLPVIAINLFIGYEIPIIDSSAHVAGLIAGALLALVIPFKQPGSRTPGFFTVLQVVLAVVVLLSFYEVAVHYQGPAISFRNLSRIME
jgi:rhomboid protease GluP